MRKNVQVIVTLGPATNSENDLKKIKDKNVDFVRVNMSHSSAEDLKYFIGLAKKVGVPFVIDTEGSQVRTGSLKEDIIELEENNELKIYAEKIIGDKTKISLTPSGVISQLAPGDLIYIDFDTVLLRVLDASTFKDGYITAKVMTGGILGKNKAVVIDSATNKKITLPPLSEKDQQSIKIGLQEGVGYIAASFMRSGGAVDEVRRATQNTMKIISKIECIDALENIDAIIQKSDYLLIDRGDLSKEIPIEKIPFTQKIIISKAKKHGVGVFVATNLLETMVKQRKPTRAEVHDVVNTIIDGATGLALSAETAIGKYPMECINTLNKLIKHTQSEIKLDDFEDKNTFLVNKLEESNYLLDFNSSSSLVSPHGGKLINRVCEKIPDQSYSDNLAVIQLTENQECDLEQIAIGAFSPLEGFMTQKDFQSVLDKMRLANGVVWPLPIILDVTHEKADELKIGNEIVLVNSENEIVGTLLLEEKYTFDKKETVLKIYGTDDDKHPGVKRVLQLNPILLGGKIKLLKRRESKHNAYSLTPKQTRRLFEERNWAKVVGFHTRNVIHKGHEFIQLEALEKENCDGLFVHPVVGTKKSGDFNSQYIIESYELMMRNFYPKNKVVFGTFKTYSHYAGPREALFTALCRKNFGCSHFIVGRDHTGVGGYYHPHASHNIFNRFPDLGIIPVKFNKVFYSKKLEKYVHEDNENNPADEDDLNISGTEARKLIEGGIQPPEWFMRAEISQMLLDSVKRGEEVFVKPSGTRKGFVIWFTGLSGSGKTTIANQLLKELDRLGKKVEVLDGDVVRLSLHKHLGFSREDIRENNKLTAELAKKKTTDTDFVLVPIISPYKEDREMVRRIIEKNFVELFINADLQSCIKRDVKGLYKKALAGEINDFIGLSDSSPYEPPTSPELEVKTDQYTVEESVEKILSYLQVKGII